MILTRRHISLILVIALPTVACSSSKFDAKPKSGLSTLHSAGAEDPAASLDPSVSSSGADSVAPEPSAPLASDPVAITPEPAIGPTIVAGASLTCIRTSVNSEVSCKAMAAGAAIDLVPKNLYHIKGSPGVWIPVAFKRTNVGTYLSDLKEAPPSTFAMALIYGNDQYLIDMVGRDLAAPAYVNLIKDPSFSGLTPKGTIDDFDYFTNTDLAALGSAWTVSNALTDSPCQTPKLKLQGIDRQLPVAPHTRWVNLLSACEADSGVGSIYNRTKLSQKFKTVPNHLHFLYYSIRRNHPHVEPNGLKLDTMINGVFYPFSYVTNDVWEMKEARIGLLAADSEISFSNVSQITDLGILLDDIQIYDLGVPPFVR